MFSDYISDELSCNLVKLVFEVSSFELYHPLVHTKHLVVTVLQDKVLALLHLLDPSDLLLDTCHGLLR